jgi:hypothetical protein
MNCFQYHLKLKKKYHDAIPYYNVDHIISKIGEKFYDETGEVTFEQFAPLNHFRPLWEYHTGKSLCKIVKQWLKQ